MPNQNSTVSETATIKLTNGMIAFIDAANYDALSKFTWRARRQRKNYYAETWIGKTPNKVRISMHRLIANTPRDKICHHVNRYSLDNHRRNLQNCTQKEHEDIHRRDTVLIKRDPNVIPDAWI